jgi:hypothetical protein
LYSGFVKSRAFKFFLKTSIASSSELSAKIHLTSFSTDLKRASNQFLKASFNNSFSQKFSVSLNILKYLFSAFSIKSSDFSIFTDNIPSFSHLFKAKI